MWRPPELGPALNPSASRAMSLTQHGFSSSASVAPPSMDMEDSQLGRRPAPENTHGQSVRVVVGEPVSGRCCLSATTSPPPLPHPPRPCRADGHTHRRHQLLASGSVKAVQQAFGHNSAAAPEGPLLGPSVLPVDRGMSGEGVGDDGSGHESPPTLQELAYLPKGKQSQPCTIITFRTHVAQIPTLVARMTLQVSP